MSGRVHVGVAIKWRFHGYAIRCYDIIVTMAQDHNSTRPDCSILLPLPNYWIAVSITTAEFLCATNLVCLVYCYCSANWCPFSTDWIRRLLFTRNRYNWRLKIRTKAHLFGSASQKIRVLRTLVHDMLQPNNPCIRASLRPQALNWIV